ncbi:MAG: hypothetical protein HY231_02190 [Acidobacteria bacterium]|nr:hypothetical protein [Acidobacteriota bacterium]
MKTKIILAILMTLSLTAFSAITTTAQHENHATKKESAPMATEGKKDMAHGQMMKDMANEPHHALAMAYHQNLAVFAKALHEQTARSSTVNVTFARDAVAEMRRSFDQMKAHQQEHMQTMSAEMQAKMSGMMEKMKMHRSQLNDQLMALEAEVQLATPDAKKVSSLAASINAQLEAMSKMHQSAKEGKMKMKM